MDPYSLPIIAPALDAVYWLVTSLAQLLTPFAGTGSAALAVIALTVMVRTLLIPVGISTVRAELTRRRLAPQLKALQRRFAKQPERLQRETMNLYSREKASPFAGCLALLLQAPVLSLVYGLFVARSINGHPNELLREQLLGVALGDTLVGVGMSAAPVFALVLVLLALVATGQRLVALRLADPSTPRWSAWLPFLTVAFAAITPLAASLYLVVSSAWTLGERRLLSARPVV